jgi:regulator of PEP synthase PpsR (kinase-PPPase family)
VHEVYVISDATGVTAERVVRAALTQFESADVNISIFGGVRSREQVRHILEQAETKQGLIVHTLVSAELRRVVLTEGRHRGMATIDLMGPLLARLTTVLATAPRSEPGLFRPFDDAYLSRIEAIRFTVNHDDGRNLWVVAGRHCLDRGVAHVQDADKHLSGLSGLAGGECPSGAERGAAARSVCPAERARLWS